MDEMGFQDNNACKDVLQMTILHHADQDNVTVPSVESLMNAFVDVISFDMIGDYSAKYFESNNVGTFLPSGSGYETLVYTSSDNLMLAHRGQQFEKAPIESWVPSTFLISFSMKALNLKIQGTAQVPGYSINQYALDIWQGHLRIASTIRAKWGCSPVKDEIAEKSSLNICRWDIVADSRNFLTVLKIPADETDVQMERVGFVDNLGKFGENIEAVRFMEDKGWVVTFLRTDPLYSMDLTNHTSPTIAGELEVTGYSNYLHPFDEEFKKLIGVGQDADENGRATGLQISLFDVDDLSNTFLIDRYSVNDDYGQSQSSSSSQAQFEPKAFRFLYGTKKLIIPASIRVRKTGDILFDGFNVYDVSEENGITVSFNVSHGGSSKRPDCWYGSNNPPRSLVHSGVLTTVKGHTVFGHNLITGQREWELTLPLDATTNCPF